MDYYIILGVPRGCSGREVTQAYRRLVRKFHPDVSRLANAGEQFSAVREAYTVLRDSSKRRAYDQYLGDADGDGAQRSHGRSGEALPRSSSSSRPGPAGIGGFSWDANSVFDALFGIEVTGRGALTSARPVAEPAVDYQVDVMVDLEASLQGGRRELMINVPEQSPDGYTIQRQRSISVSIPRGIVAGQRLRLIGLGDKVSGARRAGDLLLRVQFAPHPLYKVAGRDLHLELPVKPWEAAAGARVPIPTPSGIMKLTIPAGSSASTKLRLRGMGIPAARKGDLYIELNLEQPEAGNEERPAAQNLLAALAAVDPGEALGARVAIQ